ncbi:MAG: hypothetical protein E7447_01110 [Ruminococcaceae bacterium]|nr:hypothetical protein [Oscillospiraceae bacterium]
MENLKRVSKIFLYIAVVTLIVAVLIFVDLTAASYLNDVRDLILYIVAMIPVIFASIGVALRVIAKELGK